MEHLVLTPTQNINKKRDFLALFLIGKQMIWAITSFNKINVYHTNADKANDDGGHGGDGNWMAGGPPTPTVDLKVLVVPCRFLRMTIVWPKLRGKVAAELRGRVVAAEIKCNLTIGLISWSEITFLSYLTRWAALNAALRPLAGEEV